MLTEIDQLAETVVLTIKSAMNPMLVRMAVLEQATLGYTVDRTELKGQIATLEQRLASAEQRAMVPGPQGERGADGAVGSMGPIGPSGMDGQKGTDGVPGPTGPAGESIVGPAGDQGVPGPPGEAIVGPTGPMGPAGNDGEAIIGPMGPTGLKGEPGESIVGPVGPVGERGADGKSLEPIELEPLISQSVEKSVSIYDARFRGLEFDVEIAGAKANQASAASSAETIRAVVDEYVAKIPPAKNGKDADLGAVELSIESNINKIAGVLRAEIAGVQSKAEQAMVFSHPDAIAGMVSEKIAQFPIPKDGKDADMGVIQVSIDAAVAKATGLIPDLVSVEVSKGLSVIPPAKDGKDADMPALHTAMAAALEKGFQSLQVDVDKTTQSIHGLVSAEVSKSMSAIPTPKDGIGVAGAFIDMTGHLVVTLSDGTTKDVGLVVGKSVDPADVQRMVTDGVATIPVLKGEPGKDGKDGRDGTLENLKCHFDGERTLTLCFKDGTPIEGGVIDFKGMLRYKDIYASEKAYDVGDLVTYDGSVWMAKSAAQNKQPNSNIGAPFWKLIVKRGGDGKTGKPGEKGIDGKDGRPGRDLTHMTLEGQKY